jgi:hypothetical protein
MATRSTIKIEGINYAKAYKHYDGNPGSMLPWLVKFNQDFAENRGGDPEYKFAQLLRSSVRDAGAYDLDNSLHTGWGVVEGDRDCGEAYEYTLKKDGSVSYKQL